MGTLIIPRGIQEKQTFNPSFRKFKYKKIGPVIVIKSYVIRPNSW